MPQINEETTRKMSTCHWLENMPQINEETTRQMSTCHWLDLETLDLLTGCAQNSLRPKQGRQVVLIWRNGVGALCKVPSG